jgi:hypothetical protein
MQDERETEISPEPSSGGWWMSNRKLWFGATALILVVIVALVLIWVLPSSDDGSDVEQEDTAQQVEEEEVVEEEEPVEAGSEQQSGEGITVSPADGSSGYTVEFPDPADGTDDPAPEAGYTDIAGSWIIDMSGSIYALTNCHLNLENGQITTPADYDQVFEVMASQYSWDKESSTFVADLQVIVKMGSSGLSVPASLKLEGTVDGSMAQIEGDFYAEPQGEAYAMYSEQGTFIMHR